MLTEYDWYPPLDDLPEAGVLLLGGIRPLIPGVVEHIRTGRTDVTPEVGGDADLGAGLGRCRFTLRSTGARSTLHGPREALSFDFRGNATIAGRSQAFAGRCTVDVQTSAILDLRLSTPVEV